MQDEQGNPIPTPLSALTHDQFATLTTPEIIARKRAQRSLLDYIKQNEANPEKRDALLKFCKTRFYSHSTNQSFSEQALQQLKSTYSPRPGKTSEGRKP